MVCVVLEGGPGTLDVSCQFNSLSPSLSLSAVFTFFVSSQTIYSAMLNGTPCVVLEGSGRIADVIAHVAGLPLIQVTIALIHQLMKKFFGQTYDAFNDLEIIKWTKMVCKKKLKTLTSADQFPNFCCFPKKTYSWIQWHFSEMDWSGWWKWI